MDAVTEASTSAQTVPPPPEPVPVTLDPATTALFVQDVTRDICTRQPNCAKIVPRLAALVARARAAGVFVVYTSGANGGEPIPEVARAPDDPLIQGSQNKFFNTRLDDLLRMRGIKTVVLTGWRANGSVLFTSHGATNLRYTVVVATDAITAAQDFEVAIGLYQVLNLLNGNPTNEPLRQWAVTLSRTDLIGWQ